MYNLIVCFSRCVSGFQAGLFGVGGGAVVIPALCLFTDLSYKEALGTSFASKTNDTTHTITPFLYSFKNTYSASTR